MGKGRATDGDNWRLLGNAGTNPTSNFLGTTDANDLLIKTNNVDRIRIMNDGSTQNRIGIGTNFPTLVSGVKEYRLLIFNCWGQLVFESETPYEGWDGTFDGLPANPDTYVYKCNFLDFRNRKHERRGHFNLIR